MNALSSSRRSAASRALLFSSLVALLTGALASGHGRLHFEGRVARWAAPGALRFSLDPRGSDDLPHGAAQDAVRRAFASWSAIEGCAVRFEEVASPANPRWQRVEHHSVIFDEDGSTGWFPPGAGIVAVTPVLVSMRPDRASGELPILDADILFNGREFRFATDGRAGAFDVQSIAAHEIGHWLGFDHSACAAATMYPYATPGQTAWRSLFADDEAIARATYPSTGGYAALRGVLERGDRTAVRGGHVVVVDAEGRTVASAISARDGRFEIAGLPPGRYGAYADPLDGIVSAGELSLGFLPEIDFARTWLAGPGALQLVAGHPLELGARAVARPTSLDLEEISGALPRIVREGSAAFDLVARGRALEVGCELELAGGGLVPEGATRAFGSTIARRFRLDPGAALGARDLVVRDAVGREAVIPAALELVQSPPRLERLSPARGALGGGELATLHGASLAVIDEVRLGGARCEIVAQGEHELVVRVPAGNAGFVDLEVAGAGGESARLVEAWRYGGAAVVDHVFPRAGSSAGGTRLAVVGGPFAARVRATLDGFALPVQRIDTSTLRLAMPPHASGAVEVELFDPLDPSFALRVPFQYVEGAEPRLFSATPGRSPIAGGAPIELRGSDLVAGARLFVGVDRASWRGGEEASGVEVLSSALLRGLTPQLARLGAQTLRLELADGRGCVLEDAFLAGAMLIEGETVAARWNGGAAEIHYVEWARGEEVDLELAVEKGSGFEPRLEILDARGVVLQRVEAGGERVLRLRAYEVASTEIHALRVSGVTALAGTYEMSWRSNPRALQRKLAGTAESAGGSAAAIAIELDGRSGLSLDLRLRWPRDIEAQAVRLVGPHGELSLGERELRASGGRLDLRRVPLPSAGSYRLEVEAPLPPGARWQGALRLR